MYGTCLHVGQRFGQPCPGLTKGGFGYATPQQRPRLGRNRQRLREWSAAGSVRAEASGVGTVDVRGWGAAARVPAQGAGSRFGELAEAVRRVAAGGSVIDPAVVGDLVATHRARRSALDELSPRELQVLGEIAQGKNNAAVAAALTLTERAVEKHANAIFSKLGLTNEPDINRRVRAVLIYLNESQ